MHRTLQVVSLRDVHRVDEDVDAVVSPYERKGLVMRRLEAEFNPYFHTLFHIGGKKLGLFLIEAVGARGNDDTFQRPFRGGVELWGDVVCRVELFVCLPENIDGISVDLGQLFRGGVGAGVCLKIEKKGVCMVAPLREDERAFDLLCDGGDGSLGFLICRNIPVGGAKTTAALLPIGASVRAGKASIDAESPDMLAIAGLEALGLPVDARCFFLVTRHVHGGSAPLLCYLVVVHYDTMMNKDIASDEEKDVQI